MASRARGQVATSNEIYIYDYEQIRRDAILFISITDPYYFIMNPAVVLKSDVKSNCSVYRNYSD